jgi:hypothetical protein
MITQTVSLTAKDIETQINMIESFNQPTRTEQNEAEATIKSGLDAGIRNPRSNRVRK